MEEISQKLKMAWRLRFEQRNEECQSLFVELSQSLSLPPSLTPTSDFVALLRLAQLRGHTLALIDTLALSAALSRARGMTTSSESLLLRLESALEETGCFGTFHFFFQRGLSLFVNGDYSRAQEYFLHASSKSSDNFERCASEVNALLCLDNLGLSHSHTLKKVDDLLGHIDETDVRARDLRAQIHHFHARRSFREGRMDGLLQCSPAVSDDRWDQIRYLKLWSAMLPYVVHSYDTDSELEAFLRHAEYFPYRSYCARTVQGRWHPDDFKPVKWTEWTDRLYLWTWKWLCDPMGFPIRRVTLLLEYLIENESPPALTAEDSLMIHNALLWMGLLDRNSVNPLCDQLKKLNRHGDWECPLLNLETLVVRYFQAVRDKQLSLAQDFRQALAQHPLWARPNLGFKLLVEGAESGDLAAFPRLGTLPKHVHTFFEEKREHGQIEVDLEKGRIKKANGPAILSESTCAAIELFEREPMVSIPDFFAAVFGITRFDPTIHNARLFACFRKMREVFDGILHFRTKSSWVLCEGDWSRIKVIHQPAGYSDLAKQSAWRSFLGRREVPKKPSIPSGLLDKETLTRREMEALTGKARSTAHRILSGWENQGWVRREGHARATVYRVTPALKNHLRGEKGQCGGR